MSVASSEGTGTFGSKREVSEGEVLVGYQPFPEYSSGRDTWAGEDEPSEQI